MGKKGCSKIKKKKKKLGGKRRQEIAINRIQELWAVQEQQEVQAVRLVEGLQGEPQGVQKGEDFQVQGAPQARLQGAQHQEENREEEGEGEAGEAGAEGALLQEAGGIQQAEQQGH